MRVVYDQQAERYYLADAPPPPTVLDVYGDMQAEELAARLERVLVRLAAIGPGPEKEELPAWLNR